MASFSTLLLPIINEMLVKEIGEASIAPLKWKKVSSNMYKFLVDINDYTETVEVLFDEFKEDVQRYFYLSSKYSKVENAYNLGYQVSGNENQFAKTDLKTLLTILATVVDIAKDFLKNTEVNVLYITATPKDIDKKDTTQKSNLYQAFIKKQLEQLEGYSHGTHRDGFLVVNNKLA